LALLVLSAIFMILLELTGLPAALLLGAMAAAITVSASGMTVSLPRWPFIAAQAVIGCMMARAITPAILGTIVKDWPLMIGTIAAVIGACGGLGWLLARWRVLPGTTAIWGSSPGAATAITVMAEAYGADFRLVAFMQYLRVLLVAATASVVASIWVPHAGTHPPHPAWIAPVAWMALAETLAVAGVGAVAGIVLRIPAGALLVPLALAVVLHGTGLLTIELPQLLLAVVYAAVGWAIGLRFTRAILIYALRALPRVLLSIFALIGVCGGIGLLLSKAAGVDPLTAYLATSPGGADSVAIIASSSNVDLPFVMALQTARFTIVLLIGPSLARLLAQLAGGDTPIAEPSKAAGSA
jgi:membrane AbrB-like protein